MALSQSQMKRLTAVHGWSGTLLGLLLYVVVVTGTVAVFAEEIAVWSAGGMKTGEPLAVPLDRKVREIADLQAKGYLDRIAVFHDARGDLLIYPHTRVRHPESGELSPLGTLYRLDARTGERLSWHQGFLFDHPEWFKTSALEAFLVELHVRLHLPEPWGLIVTGILGLLVMFAGISGVLMHRHLFRDLFIAERPGRRLVSTRDRHVLAASWALPFSFLLGFTGSYFSFAGTVFFPLLADVAFGGNDEAMVQTLFAPPAGSDPTPAPLTDLDAVLIDAADRAGAPVTFIFIDRYGRSDALITLNHGPAPHRLGFQRSLYDGATGAFLGFKPNVGRQPSSGATLRGLMTPLHFGNFAGMASKVVWAGLGIALAFVTISGMQLWLRRREADLLWRRFGRAIIATAYGLPLAMLMSSYGYFVSRSWSDPFWWTPVSFVAGVLGSIVLGWVSDAWRLRRLFRVCLAIGCLLLPVARMASGGTAWAPALIEGQGTLLSVDLFLLLLGCGLWLWSRRPESDRGGDTANSSVLATGANE